jgi:hypothetical protein
MPAPAVKVELGLNLGQSDPFAFVLNDAVRGVLDRIDSGVATITVDNSDRVFDPLYPNGPYFGQLIPRRSVRITTNNQPVFIGAIDDFDIVYAPSNKSQVAISVSDAFSVLTNSGLEELTPTSQLSGARVNAVLDRPEVDWPASLREIDPGNSTMAGALVEAGTTALEYLQLVSNSEFGNLFIGKDGKVVFRERNAVPNTPNLVFSDEIVAGQYTGIQFSSVQNVYGSETLYNRIAISNSAGTPLEAFAEDATSQIVYGPRTYSASGLLVESQSELQFLADFLLARYKEPQYRFDSVAVILDTLTTANQNAVLDLEIGDIVLVRFEPSDIPPAIEQYCRIIGISHTWDQTTKTINFALERLDFAIFILNDPVLGELDNDRLAYE